MSAEQLALLNSLIQDTIVPALYNDFNFTTPAQVQEAIESIKTKMSQIDVNSIVPMDLDED